MGLKILKGIDGTEGRLHPGPGANVHGLGLALLTTLNAGVGDGRFGTFRM